MDRFLIKGISYQTNITLVIFFSEKVSSKNLKQNDTVLLDGKGGL